MIWIPPNIEIWGEGSDEYLGRIKSVYGTPVGVVSVENRTKKRPIPEPNRSHSPLQHLTAGRQNKHKLGTPCIKLMSSCLGVTGIFINRLLFSVLSWPLLPKAYVTTPACKGHDSNKNTCRQKHLPRGTIIKACGHNHKRNKKKTRVATAQRSKPKPRLSASSSSTASGERRWQSGGRVSGNQTEGTISILKYVYSLTIV